MATNARCWRKYSPEKLRAMTLGERRALLVRRAQDAAWTEVRDVNSYHSTRAFMSIRRIKPTSNAELDAFISGAGISAPICYLIGNGSEIKSWVGAGIFKRIEAACRSIDPTARISRELSGNLTFSLRLYSKDKEDITNE